MSLVAVALVGALVLVPGQVASAGCGGVGGWTSTCSSSNEGSHVDVTGSMTTPGDHGGTPGSDAGQGSRPKQETEPGSRPKPTPTPECRLNSRCDIPYEVVALPDVTIDDLASFHPARPTLGSEPSGFGVVGMPANFVGAASEQRIPGTLFDFDVVVRFVPAAYVFEFGDGATLRSSTGGASWDRLGQAQFTPTATSHAYRERGTYAVRVTVQYAASVDFGSGMWRPVPGYVSASADPYDVEVVAVRTALVERTCLEDPAGPGC